MPVMQGSSSIAANAQTDDVLVNNPLAIARGRQVVEYAIVAAATGLVVDVLVGTNTIAYQIAPSIQNRIPLFPDDFLGSFVVLNGDRIILRVRNTTGGAIVVYYSFRSRAV